MKWEQIDGYHQRVRVYGGWLVKAYEDVISSHLETGYEYRVPTGYEYRVSMCFVPDENHEWQIKDNK